MAGIILPEVDHNNPFNVSPHGLRPGGSTAHGPTSPRKESTVNPSSPRRTSQTPRRKSSAAQIELPTASEAEIRALAKVFHARLGTLPIDDRNSAGKFLSWLDLFNHMDLDGSGGVDFAEFEWMIRKELGVHVSSLPNETLRALWNALDLDRSGAISFGEFGHFMRYCAKEDEGSSPSAVIKLGQSGRRMAGAQSDRKGSYVLPSGVTMLSESDSEALEGVDNPHVRFLLFQKSVSHLPALAPAPSKGSASPPRRPSNTSPSTRASRAPRQSPAGATAAVANHSPRVGRA